MKKTGLVVPNGTGFYILRRTAATIATRSGDPFAVQRLLGHTDLTMATRYVRADEPVYLEIVDIGAYEYVPIYCHE